MTPPDPAFGQEQLLTHNPGWVGGGRDGVFVRTLFAVRERGSERRRLPFGATPEAARRRALATVGLEKEFVCDALPVNLIGMDATTVSQYIKFTWRSGGSAVELTFESSSRGIDI